MTGVCFFLTFSIIKFLRRFPSGGYWEIIIRLTSTFGNLLTRVKLIVSVVKRPSPECRPLPDEAVTALTSKI